MEKFTNLLIGFLVLSLAFFLIERAFAAQKRQKVFRAGYKTDLIYWIFTPLVSKTITRISVAIVLAVMLGVRPQELPAALFERDTWVTRLPLWAQIISLLVIGDFIGYWMHRLFHGRRLWRFHAVHHCSTELDWLSSVRLHPVNDALSKVAVVVVLIGIGFNPKVIAAYVPFLALYAIMLHANVTWGFGLLGQVIASPRFHRWHHTAQEEGLDKNFAGLFPWIDRIFGTYYMPEGRLPEKFGIRGEQIPENFWAQMVYPFKKKAV
jgi:sterol desaturase/sphingolipid hydroxylase (fatty acid hydroxylase superfamily)